MKTYSHPATRQDLWLLEVFGDKFDGTAIEIGGHDGVTHSNTLLLEELGWGCTLIEAVPEFYELMTYNRPNALCIHAAVGKPAYEDAPLLMYVNGQYSGLSCTMSPYCVDGHLDRKSERIWVQPKHLTELVDARHFNYMSLDTEGNEISILQDWFDKGGTCDALTVEFNYDYRKFDRLKHLCAGRGMRLDRVQGFDMFFIREGA